tara:strand:- start:220 stop:792 length:573 start_codon:yes stop_codon:yes gene_type:complete
MNLAAIIFLLSTITSTNLQENNPSYEELVNQAMTSCKGARGKKVDVDLLWKLVEVERHYKPAPKIRGMILAAACMESAYNPKAKGDHKFSKSGKKPKAIGILQLWPIYEKMYPGLDRTNPVEAGHAWMKHIVKMIPRVKKQCRYKTPERIWVAAWVTGIRYKKPGGRCNERPKHLRILKRWHRNIMKSRK